MKNLFFLVILFLGHWAGDFTALVSQYMHKAKAVGRPLGPIFLHALFHSIIVGVILIYFVGFSSMVLGLVLFELVTHFVFDVTKGRLNGTLPQFQDNTSYPYWMLFGIDQFLHHTVLILIWGKAIGMV